MAAPQHITPSRRELRRRFRKYLASCRELIAEHGHMIQFVGALDPESASWAYTVGLTEKKGYELAVTGLPAKISARLLNRASDVVEHLEAGQMVEGVLDSHTLQAHQVGDTSNFGTYVSLTGVAPPLVYQLLIPDADGRFPGQDGYAFDPLAQPLL